jgi:glycoprotein-N-acetylgalactosamine 3-beta-galactosyltransferase
MEYYQQKNCAIPFGQDSEGTGGYEALKRIQISPPLMVTDHDKYDINKNITRPLKLLCMVYSVATEHNLQMIQAVRETWGHSCDGSLVASNITNATLGMVHIPHFGAEEYEGMWQKVRSMWSYVYDNAPTSGRIQFLLYLWG